MVLPGLGKNLGKLRAVLRMQLWILFSLCTSSLLPSKAWFLLLFYKFSELDKAAKVRFYLVYFQQTRVVWFYFFSKYLILELGFHLYQTKGTDADLAAQFLPVRMNQVSCFPYINLYLGLFNAESTPLSFIHPLFTLSWWEDSVGRQWVMLLVIWAFLHCSSLPLLEVDIYFQPLGKPMIIIIIKLVVWRALNSFSLTALLPLMAWCLDRALTI